MIATIQEGYVKSQNRNGVTTIEFFHPQGNSLPGKILELLARAIHGAAYEDDCKVVVLKSGGERAFCGGASFDELMAVETEKQGIAYFSGFGNVINAMRKCPKLIIGRIHGKCVGGGVGLAAACDHAMAVQGADVKLSELSVGIAPFVIGPAVERKIGLSAFSQLAIDASYFRTADWARRRGLFAELHATVEEMDESIRKLSSTLANRSPQAMAEMKKMFWQGTEHWDQLLKDRAALSGKLVLTFFTKDAIAKFKAGNRDM
jgi:methylglutaconyl-CoA hydratase